ncbi:hypothetical protein IW262DRAFT_1301035 [Armillaria fumosa]|nr:hypothetical protein IW262DRAFT_1301035 [Armillaria fumosa]
MRHLFLLLLFSILLGPVRLPHIPNSPVREYGVAENEATTAVCQWAHSTISPSPLCLTLSCNCQASFTWCFGIADATDVTSEGAARYQSYLSSSTSHLDILTDFTSTAQPSTPSSNVSSTDILTVAGALGVFKASI